MTQPRKFGYALDLSSRAFAAGTPSGETDGGVLIRPVAADDAEALAELVLEGYLDTIDFEGEEIDEARSAVTAFFADEPLLDASMIAFVEGTAASAVLVVSLDGAPFISMVVAHPAHKRKGLATEVVTAACRQLAADGETEVTFAITDGNVASEALFAGLGAVRLER